MAAATSDRSGHLHFGSPIEQYFAPVAANTTIYLGTLVSQDANGYLIPAADTLAQAGKEVWYAFVRGVANDTATNGKVTCTVMTRGTARLPKGSLVQADVGKTVHVADDQTPALTSTNNRPIGRLVAIEGSDALVKIG